MALARSRAAGTDLSMDTLSRATEELRLLRATYQRRTVQAPAIQDAEPSRPAFHLVEQGNPVLRVGTRERVLAPGDVVLVPRGLDHVFEARRRSFRLLTGELAWVVADHPILQSLPELIVIDQAALEASPHWKGHLASLIAEIESSRPGAATLRVRLTDVILIEAMRTQSPPHGGAECPVGGWMQAAEDGVLAPVLAQSTTTRASHGRSRFSPSVLGSPVRRSRPTSRR
jgi:hypothetical protein